MALKTLLGQIDPEAIKKLPGKVRDLDRVQQHIDAFALHLQGVSFRGIQKQFGWKAVSTAENSVKRGEQLAKDLGLDNERIKLKLANFFDEILDITMHQVKEQVEAGRITIDIDPDGKRSMRITKGVDPRLLGEAGRGAIRFAEFCWLLDRAPTVETYVFNAGAFAQLIGGPGPQVVDAEVVEVEAMPNSVGD